MRFRWKLLILFLTMTLVPMLIMRVLGKSAVSKLGSELVFRMTKNRSASMQQRQQLLLNTYSSLIRASQKQVEMALLLQANEVKRCLARQASMPVKIFFAEDFNKGSNLPSDTTLSTRHFKIKPDGSMGFLKISYSHQVFKIPRGILKKDVEGDIARLSAMTPVYRRISQRLNGLVSWQVTSLENGLHSAYPGHNGIPRRLDPRKQPWYTTALEKNATWSEPYVDPETRQIVVAATIPVEYPPKEIKGVTSLIIPISNFFDRGQFKPDMPPSTETFMCYLTADPKTGTKGIQIYIREAYSNTRYRSWRAQIGSDWLTMLADFEADRGNTRRMTYNGKEALWVYGAARSGLFFVLITPYEEILKGLHQPERFIQNLISNLLSVTQYGMVVIVLIIIIVSFTFSKTITRPIHALVDSARRLAAGDFDSQVNIRSRDEFKDVGTVFNTIGPRLKELYQMRHSMALAREVQQHLIPRNDPDIHGLDIAGKSIYCDETGGDYFDYLNINTAGALDIAVGDVSDHGIPSALLMTTARALLKQSSATSGHISRIVSDVNFHLTRDIESSGRFMTLFYCHIDYRKKRVQWVRAGHDPAFLFDPVADAFFELKGKGLPLGVFIDSEYEASEREIDSGQILIVGTDGIWETMDPQGNLFGKKRFQDIIRSHAAKSSAEILAAVLDAVDNFRASQEQKDDVTLVIAKIR